MAYRCAVCGQEHEALPDLGFTWPDYYFSVPADQRESRVRGDSDTCRIDDHCFIRGVILMPLADRDESFGIGAWVSQHPDNFAAYLANYDSADIGPFFGWLSNRLPFYSTDTLALKARACFQGGTRRPLIELAECDHPLYRDWCDGVPLDRVMGWIHQMGGTA